MIFSSPIVTTAHVTMGPLNYLFRRNDGYIIFADEILINSPLTIIGMSKSKVGFRIYLKHLYSIRTIK